MIIRQSLFNLGILFLKTSLQNSSHVELGSKQPIMLMGI